MPEEDFHLSSQVHFQAHMPSPAGLVSALPLNPVIKEQLCSSRATYAIRPTAKSQ